MSIQYLSVKNFDQYQHYRDRRPPWIKLYQTILEDYAFTRLPSASKWHLVGLFLLASRYENKIPYDLPWITGELKATEAIDVDELVIAGFVTVSDARNALAPRKHRASKPLAARKQNAMPERERERERETEQTLPAPDGAAGQPDVPARPTPLGTSRAKGGAKYPHFLEEERQACYRAWGQLGEPSYGHFVQTFAPLFGAVRRYTLEEILGAIDAAIQDAKAEGGYALRNLTPRKCVDQISHWVAYAKIPIVDPGTGWLTEKGEKLTRPPRGAA